MSARVVWFVVPDTVDDPTQVSGGNVCDLRVRDGLEALGWDVRFTTVEPDAAVRALATVPPGALVLVDGLVAGRSPGAVEAAARCARVVVLAHMVSAAFADADLDIVEGERRAFRAAHAIVTTSAWTRDELVRRALADPDRIVVATPGADVAAPAIGTADGVALLCVGVVAAHKGQDVLVEALAGLRREPAWTCTIAGSLETDPAYAGRVEELARVAGLDGRVRMPGALVDEGLEGAYRDADLLVAPSLVESYGMVIADALGRGIPVIASDVGGIPEAVAPSRAAVLVPPGDPGALRDALGRWMRDAALRERLRCEARRGRGARTSWTETATRVAEALEGVR
ncbi:glycosyltransferase family 4 protein [Microbacterium sp. B2969]|uniref:Glycosyltransferase family 4 protein n=1 Tax=Microbacterium alkaliflavum TaxID=3248839 RepID=A0ABW7QAY4_9MICO